MPDDYTATTQTTGTVAVGGSATGEIDYWGDSDWFAVTLEADRTYRIDLEGRGTRVGTLSNPYLYGIYDADGNRIAGTKNDDGGGIYNSRVTFTAAEDATYYVAAGAYRSRGGTYRLSVRDVTDDFAPGTGTTGEVAVGGTARGEIELRGDRDWFAVTLEADRVYQIDLGGRSTSAGTLSDPHLRGVYDADGDLIAYTMNNNGGEGLNSRVTFVATEDATYYVAAGAWGGRTGTYTLSVRDVTDDFAAGTNTNGAVAVDGSATGEIESAGDRDWFAVTLDADRTYLIDLEGSDTGAGTLLDPYLYGIHDANGVRLAGTTDDNGGAGTNSRVTFTAAADGTYYVAAGADGNWEGTYTLSVADVTDDFAAGTNTNGTVSVDGSVTGEIEVGGDRDWFAVTLEADKTYLIDLEGSDTGAGTLDDPYLYGVHDADGELIPGTTNDDNGIFSTPNSRVTFTAAADGTYYVAAGAVGEGEGTYTLWVEETADDFAAGTGTIGTVTVGGSTTGEIHFNGDRDWFAVTLEAGKTYLIDLEGSETGAGTLRDTYLRGVHDADGVRLSGTTNDDGGAGRNSRVTFTATEDATHYVAAGADGSQLGTYTLSVREAVDDYAADTGTAGAVAVDGSVTGEIEAPDDHDWFAVTLEADKTYRIDLEGSSTSAGTLFDPYLRGVYDANGDLIPNTTDDNGGAGFNSRWAFTATEDATYYVAAGAYGVDLGTYTLSVADVTDSISDDFEAGTGTNGAVSVGGSVTGEIEVSGDRDWFAVTLDADRVYQIDLEGSDTGAGTLYDPYLRGIHDADGNLLAGTTDGDGGADLNSRVTFTAAADGIYYVAAGGWGSRTGTYTLSVAEFVEAADDGASGRSRRVPGRAERWRWTDRRRARLRSMATATGSRSNSMRAVPTGSTWRARGPVPAPCRTLTCTVSTTRMAT